MTLTAEVAASAPPALAVLSTLFSTLLPALVVVANILGVGMIVPQAARLRRHRCTDGLSGAWIGLGLSLNLWWLAYALHEQLWGLLPVSTGAFILYAFITAQILTIERRAGAAQLLFGAFVLGSMPLPFLLLGGWRLAGMAIGFSYGVQFLPAAVAAFRSTSLAGVSMATWTMAWVEAAIWLLYGLSLSDPALISGGGGGLLVSSLILALLVDKPRQVVGTSRGQNGLRSEPPVRQSFQYEPSRAANRFGDST